MPEVRQAVLRLKIDREPSGEEFLGLGHQVSRLARALEGAVPGLEWSAAVGEWCGWTGEGDAPAVLSGSITPTTVGSTEEFVAFVERVEQFIWADFFAAPGGNGDATGGLEAAWDAGWEAWELAGCLARLVTFDSSYALLYLADAAVGRELARLYRVPPAFAWSGT